MLDAGCLIHYYLQKSCIKLQASSLMLTYLLPIILYMTEQQQNSENEYKAGPIDSMIVSTLQSMDKGGF